MHQLIHAPPLALLTYFVPSKNPDACFCRNPLKLGISDEIDAVEKLNCHCAHGSAKANASEFNARAGGL
jgi:hypothetical protein